MFIPCTSFSFASIFSKQYSRNSKFCTLLEQWGCQRKDQENFWWVVAPLAPRRTTTGRETKYLTSVHFWNTTFLKCFCNANHFFFKFYWIENGNCWANSFLLIVYSSCIFFRINKERDSFIRITIIFTIELHHCRSQHQRLHLNHDMIFAIHE